GGVLILPVGPPRGAGRTCWAMLSATSPRVRPSRNIPTTYRHTQQECDTASPSHLHGYLCTVVCMLATIKTYSCLAPRNHGAGQLLLEAQRLAFSGTKTLDRETPLRYLSTTQRHNVIYLGVRVTRIVVEQYQALGVGLLGDVQGIEVSGMSPADAMRLVFLWRVLGILNEQISITCQGHVLGRLRQVPRCRRIAKGFIVSGVRQDCAIGGKAVSQGTSGMIYHSGCHGDPIGEFHHAPFAKLDKLDLGSHSMHRDRKVRAPHLARNDLFERQPSMLGTQDRQFRASDIGRGKKGQA